MNNEVGLQVYRKLIYFFENEIPIHFSLLYGGWKNGKIKELNKEELTVVIIEFEEGELPPFLLEDIRINSISKFRPKNEVQK